MLNLIGTVGNIWQFHSTTVLITAIAVIITCKMIYSHYKALRYFKELGIPGPKPWPLLGNIPAVMVIGDQNSAHLKFTNEYGKVFGMFYLSEPVIVVSEFDIVKKILIKDFHAFPNRQLPFKLPLNSLSKAVAIARDQEWKRIRDILTPTFTGNKLRSSFLIVDDITTKLVQSLIDSSQKKEIVNIRKVLGEFTMETMLSVAFGVQMLNSKLIHSAIQIFDRGQLRVLMSIFSPTLLKVIRKSPFDFDAKYFQHLDRTARQVIKYRRQSDQPARRDVLQLMMEAESNGKLSDDEIIAQSIVFLLAGYETTANTISFAVYLLATHPEIQDKLINEIDDALQTQADSFNYDKIHELKYLDMVVSETLRLYPTASTTIREVACDHTIDKYKFKKGGTVMISAYALHRNSKEWPDPEKFIPERFTQEEKQKRNPLSYLPFGGGPRVCIGMRFALMEIKIALVRILQKVKFTVVKETEIPLQLRVGPTLSPKNGIKLGIEVRE